MKEDSEFYVYIYLDPRKKGKYEYEGLDFCFLFEPFYVGKGKGNRYKDHLFACSIEKGNNKYKNNKLKNIFKIISKDFFTQNFIYFYKKDMIEIEAVDTEILLIDKIGRDIFKEGSLTNITCGGEGWGVPWNKGKKCPSIGRKGKIPWNKGKTDIYSKETLSEMSKKHKGRIISKETKKKMSKASKEHLTLFVSDSVRQVICNLYLQGYTLNQLVKEYNILMDKKIRTRHVIIRILKEEGIKRGNRYRATRLTDSYEELFDNQYTFAEKYSLSQSCINRCLNKISKIHKGWMFEKL